MEKSDFVIKETVTNSGEKTYIIGRMLEQSITFLQELGIRKKAIFFKPVNYDLRTEGVRESFPHSVMMNFGSYQEAEKYISKKLKEKHDRQIKSERIIELK